MRIKKDSVPDFLGPHRYISDVAMRTSQSGVATGLAWTSAGGSIMFIEATKMSGGKNLTLTGQLGDVMKESAQAALSLVRTYSENLGLEEKFFEKIDVHIHVPAGSIPKDGPSAGITILVALVSLLVDKSIRPEIAMTGEITLRGLILPVGGIKEKVLAAHRAGIKKVIIPAENQKDLVDVPKQIQKELTFHFVKRIEEVIDLTLPGIFNKNSIPEKSGKKRKRSRKR
jgi:ATP-dependent Lon protease